MPSGPNTSDIRTRKRKTDHGFPDQQAQPGCQLGLSAHARHGPAFSTPQESGANSLRQLSTLLQPQCIPAHFHFSLLAAEGVIAVRQMAAACAASSDCFWKEPVDDHMSNKAVSVFALVREVECSLWSPVLIDDRVLFCVHSPASLNVARSTCKCTRCLGAAELDGHSSSSG